MKNKFNKFVTIELSELKRLQQIEANYKESQMRPDRITNNILGYLERPLEKQTRFVLNQLLKTK